MFCQLASHWMFYPLAVGWKLVPPACVSLDVLSPDSNTKSNRVTLFDSLKGLSPSDRVGTCPLPVVKCPVHRRFARINTTQNNEKQILQGASPSLPGSWQAYWHVSCKQKRTIVHCARLGKFCYHELDTLLLLSSM